MELVTMATVVLMKLFMLYKAIRAVIEKAPIDAVTGNSRNTLAEERLLKNRVEYETSLPE
jgi:hypothetical protein